MSETWYRTDKWSWKISPVKVLGETERMLTVEENYGRTPTARKVMKFTEHSQHFKTWEDARQNLLQRARVREQGLSDELARVREAISELTNRRQDAA